MQRHLLYNQFVAWTCNGSSVAPLSGYTNNHVFQELVSGNDYFELRSDERMYLHLRASSGYVKEAEKLSTFLKRSSNKEIKIESLGAFFR